MKNGLKVWNNEARLGIRGPLLVWVLFLVSVLLASTMFLTSHFAACCVLAGFVISHVIVFTLSAIKADVRIGMVSLSHLICWSPGFLALVYDVIQSPPIDAYGIWAIVALITLTISFYFDIRDGLTYLVWRLRKHHLQPLGNTHES